MTTASPSEDQASPDVDEQEDEFTPCPMCGNEEIVVLGTMGNTTHCRCRACGWTFSV